MQDYEIIFRDFLKQKGLKLTFPRKAILETIFAYHRHFDIDALYEVIRTKYDNVSRATVYRTMPLLVESGLIKQSLRCQAKDNYEHIYGHRDHLHFICEKCGAILEVESEAIDNVIKHLAEENHFQLNIFNLNARGICKNCLQNREL
ncbi:MAG TPA: Fur family transcriptional regulator [Candidatus Cloacimonadota bacterium]|nr:Fur family transcriptional regulator [Candidatus Cloacimonadota bacterium]